MLKGINITEEGSNFFSHHIHSRFALAILYDDAYNKKVKIKKEEGKDERKIILVETIYIKEKLFNIHALFHLYS